MFSFGSESEGTRKAEEMQAALEEKTVPYMEQGKKESPCERDMEISYIQHEVEDEWLCYGKKIRVPQMSEVHLLTTESVRNSCHKVKTINLLVELHRN